MTDPALNVYSDSMDNPRSHCPDCGCVYGSPNAQLFCRDGGCDCHYESGSYANPVPVTFEEPQDRETP